MLQNLTKGKMVEWVVLLIALVALGLSIAAVAKPCSSNFADTCQNAKDGGVCPCVGQKCGVGATQYDCCDRLNCDCVADSPGPPSSNCTIDQGKGLVCDDARCYDCKPPCTITSESSQYPFGRCVDPNQIRAQENEACYTPGCFNCDEDDPLCDTNLVCRRPENIPEGNSVCQKCTPKGEYCRGKSSEDKGDAMSCCDSNGNPSPVGKYCAGNECKPPQK